jgi:hypothetical protein
MPLEPMVRGVFVFRRGITIREESEIGAHLWKTYIFEFKHRKSKHRLEIYGNMSAHIRGLNSGNRA